MSRVYLAHDRKLDREVAVKILSERYASDPAFVERFRREATSAAALNHPNIVSVFDRGEANGAYYIVMEYLAGPDLKREIREQGPFTPVEAIDVQLQILSALGAAHRRNVIHRDVKPQNVMFTDDGRVKVTDFGIARAGATDLTEAGLIIGTAQYLSPEQAQGREVTSASDCYAAGIVLYEMLTGRVPFDGDRPVTVALMQVNDAPADPRTIDPTIPAELAGVVMKALEKHPTDRYTSAEDFTRALRNVRDELTGEGDTRIMRQDTAETSVIQQTAETTVIPARRAQPGPPPPSRRSGPPSKRDVSPAAKGRGRLVAALVGLLAVIAAATAFWLIAGRGESTVAILNVQALSADDAQTALEKQEFVVRIVRQANADVEEGKVIGTRPGSETRVAKKSRVDLLISTGPTQKPVPDVRNMDATRANATLKNAGFDPIEDPPAFDDTVPKGSVISQNPEALVPAAPGAEVRLVVSKGADLVVVPDLSKLSVPTASTQLEGVKLQIGKQDPRDSRAQPGTIIGQTPARGAKVPPGTLVNVVVAKVPDTITIPTGLVGQNAKAVLAKLEALNLSAISQTVDPPNGEAEGIVVGLNSPEGSKVDPDRTIVISVSSGPPPPASPTVPNVVGQTREAAQETLTQQGFAVNPVTEVPTNGEPAGQVLGQDPAPDQSATQGSTVTIVVSSGPPPPP